MKTFNRFFLIAIAALSIITSACGLTQADLDAAIQQERQRSEEALAKERARSQAALANFIKTVKKGDDNTAKTKAFVHYYLQAQRDLQMSFDRCEREYHICQDSNNGTDCGDKSNKCQNEAYGWYTKRMNARGQALCGIDVVGEKAKRKDTDGDGVYDAYELRLGLNPCLPTSYGNVDDGKIDTDGDGKPNATDDDPFCNPKSYPSDCV